jgi:hypothetical protein
MFSGIYPMPNMKQKKRCGASGKVIRFFTVEIADVSSAPELYANSNNPYSQLSDEERAKEFDAISGLLLAESCREAGQGVKKYLQRVTNIV